MTTRMALSSDVKQTKENKKIFILWHRRKWEPIRLILITGARDALLGS